MTTLKKTNKEYFPQEEKQSLTETLFDTASWLLTASEGVRLAENGLDNSESIILLVHILSDMKVK